LSKWQDWGAYAKRCGNYSVSKCIVNGKPVYELWKFEAQIRGDRENIFNEKMLYRGASFNECVEWYQKIG
jgi:hypothetical protein